VVPYTLDSNDMRFASAQGFNTGEQFFTYLKDTFDVLYAEGEVAPKMLSVGLHCRLAGRPGRIAGLERFLRYAAGHQDVWFLPPPGHRPSLGEDPSLCISMADFKTPPSTLDQGRFHRPVRRRL